MADAPTLSPELSRSVSTLARALVAAARSWALYPADHPAVRGSLDRLRQSIADAANGQPFSFGVTPDTLLVEGAGDVVIAPHHKPDGSPMLTSQAAAVVAAYRHLVGIVDVLSPERRPWAVVEAVDPEAAGLDPLAFM